MLNENIEDKAGAPPLAAAACADRALHKTRAGSRCPSCATMIPPGPFTPAQRIEYGLDGPDVAPTRDVRIAPDVDELAAIAEREKAREAVQAAVRSEQRALDAKSRLWGSSGPETRDRHGNVKRDEAAWSARRDALDADLAAAHATRVEAEETFRRAAVKATRLGQRRNARVRAAMATTAGPVRAPSIAQRILGR